MDGDTRGSEETQEQHAQGQEDAQTQFGQAEEVKDTDTGTDDYEVLLTKQEARIKEL
jgi:hypothetical protein